MASTGVVVDDAVVSEFNEVKLGRVKAKFLIYKIDNTKIVKESMSPASASFNDLLAALPADDCRYALYDMDFTTTDGRPANKLVFISWAPDSATVKKKMIFAGSKDALTRAFVGVGTKVSATDMSELTEEILIEACRKFA